jgi:hypothetical protein
LLGNSKRVGNLFLFAVHGTTQLAQLLSQINAYSHATELCELADELFSELQRDYANAIRKETVTNAPGPE